MHSWPHCRFRHVSIPILWTWKSLLKPHQSCCHFPSRSCSSLCSNKYQDSSHQCPQPPRNLSKPFRTFNALDKPFLVIRKRIYHYSRIRWSCWMTQLPLCTWSILIDSNPDGTMLLNKDHSVEGLTFWTGLTWTFGSIQVSWLARMCALLHTITWSPVIRQWCSPLLYRRPQVLHCTDPSWSRHCPNCTSILRLHCYEPSSLHRIWAPHGTLIDTGRTVHSCTAPVLCNCKIGVLSCWVL